MSKKLKGFFFQNKVTLNGKNKFIKISIDGMGIFNPIRETDPQRRYDKSVNKTLKKTILNLREKVMKKRRGNVFV